MIVRWLVRNLDARLRRRNHIREFCQDNRCLLRLALTTSDRDLTLSDGTRIARGEPIGELHLWNEHIPVMPKAGPDLAWGLTLQRRLLHSWAELAAYVEGAPEFRGVRAFRGELAVRGHHELAQAAELAGRWGLELVTPDGPLGAWQRFVDFWRNVYALALIWTYNPASLKGKGPVSLQRGQFWISRATLVRKHLKRAKTVPA